MHWIEDPASLQKVASIDMIQAGWRLSLAILDAIQNSARYQLGDGAYSPLHSVEARFGSIGDSMVYEQYPHRWIFPNSGTTLRLKEFSPTMASGFDNVRTREDMIKLKRGIVFDFDVFKDRLISRRQTSFGSYTKKLSRGEDTFNLIETGARICPQISQAFYESHNDRQLVREDINTIVELLKHKAQIIEYKKPLRRRYL